MTSRSSRAVLWVGATIVGLAGGGFVLHFPGSFGDALSWQVGAMVFGAILGAMTGVVVGIVQWAALRLHRREGGRLLLWMAITIGVTHALNDGGPTSIGIVAVSLLAGLGAGVAFAILYRDQRLAVIGGAGWTVGLIAANLATAWLGLPWEETPVGWATDHAVDGVIVGLVWGTVTAAAGMLDRLR